MKKKIYKALSLLLTLVIVFSACLCVFNTVYAAEKTYFVSSTGNDSQTGANRHTALKTVGKAVELAKSAGYGAGDTVTIKVLNTTAVAWLSGTETFMPEYDFKLVVTSQAPAGNAVIGNGSTVNMGGDVEFTNIKVNFGSNNTNFCANGYNLTFGAGTVFEGNAIMSGFSTAAYSAVKKSTYTEAINVVNTLPIKYFGLVSNYSTSTFNEDINISYSAAQSPVFYVTALDGTTKINKALNVTIKSATGASFSKQGTGKFVFGENGYMQVLNASPSELTADSFPVDVEASKLWALNNKLRAADLLELTDTKGKFKVNTEVYQGVKATLVSDPNTVINAEGGYLTLPAGVYNITASKIPQTGVYYVKDRGNGDGSSAESPLGDIVTAINTAISDGYIVGDTVKIMIVGDKVNMDTLPSYAFNLELDSNDPAVQPRIVTTGAIANNAGGLTTFGNVEVYRESQWASMQLQSSSVIFSEKSKYTVGYGTSIVFGTGNGGGSAENVPGQKLVYSAADAPYAIYLSNWSWAKRTYSDVVELEYNVPGGSSEIRLNSSSSGNVNGTTTYKKALNINVKAAKTLTFKMADGATFEEGFQIINSGVDALDNTTGELSKVPADKLYLINNTSGNNNIIEFTETIGKYKVNLDNPEHVLVAKNLATGVETTYDGTSGFINLAAGAYQLRIDRDPVYAYYYVDSENGVEVAEGTRPEGVGTKENPVKTYADATRLISKDGLADIDVATIIIPSGGETVWGSSPATFACQLIITSSMEGDPGTLRHTPSSAVSLTGNTTLKNMNLVLDYQWGGFRLGGYNFTVEEDAYADVRYTRIWNTGYGVKHTKDQNITIKGEFITNSIELGAEYHSHTCTGDINIYYDSPSSSATILLGGGKEASSPNIYEGNINITIMNASAFSLGNRKTGADIRGSLQILVDDSVKLPYSVKTNFDNFEAVGGKWYITNAASDDNFVGFTSNKGVYSFKGDTAYSRQLGKDQVKHTGGAFDFSSASGSYTVSDKAIAPLKDESHKMLYFRTSGSAHNLSTRAKVTPGETYRFEYSIFTSMYEDCKPAIRDDGDRGVTCEVKIISEKKVGNYYRIVAEGTIPDDYRHGSTACFGVNLSAYSEGVIFDRTVYNVNDPTKKNCFEGNPDFHDGLDYVTYDQAEFWGKIIHGAGQVAWTNGFDELEVMTYDEKFMEHLLALNNPNDGKWWQKDDIIPEDTFATYAKAKGTFKDQNGKPISGAKMMLVSDTKSYTARTNGSGKFNFGKILTGYYELFVVNGSNKISTGFSAYIAQDDVVTFNVVTDTSAAANDSLGDLEFDGDNSGATSSFTGTVYTPQRETVAGLKILLKNGDAVTGEVVTDEKGTFGFANIPVGTYQLYAVNEDGSEYYFRDIDIEEGLERTVKLKYEGPASGDNIIMAWLPYIIIASVVALLAVAGLVVFLVLRKKKAE